MHPRRMEGDDDHDGERIRVEEEEEEDGDDSSDDDDSDSSGEEEDDGDGDSEGDDDDAEGEEGELEEDGEEVEIIEVIEEEEEEEEEDGAYAEEEDREAEGAHPEEAINIDHQGRAEEEEEEGGGGLIRGGDNNDAINRDLNNDEYWRPQEMEVLHGLRQRCRRDGARARLCQLTWGTRKRARSDLHEYDTVPRVLELPGQQAPGTPPRPPRQTAAGSPALKEVAAGSPRQQAPGSPRQPAEGPSGQQPRRSARLEATGPAAVQPPTALLQLAEQLPRPPPRVTQGRLRCLDHVITFNRRSVRRPAPQRAPPRQPGTDFPRGEHFLGMKVVDASDLDTAYNRLVLPERAGGWLDTRGLVPPQVVLVLDEETAGPPSGWFMKYSKWDGGRYVLHGMELLPFLQHLACVPGQDCLGFFYVPRMHTLRLLKGPIHPPDAHLNAN